MTLTAIEDVFYYVSDMERAIAFYTSVLPFRLVFRDPVWSGLVMTNDPSPDPVKLGLLAIEGPVPQHVEQRGERQLFAGGTLSLRTDDVVADVSRLRALGVTILEVLAPGDWGAGALFLDPDGNRLMLYQPPEALA